MFFRTLKIVINSNFCNSNLSSIKSNHSSSKWWRRIHSSNCWDNYSRISAPNSVFVTRSDSVFLCYFWYFDAIVLASRLSEWLFSRYFLLWWSRHLVWCSFPSIGRFSVKLWIWNGKMCTILWIDSFHSNRSWPHESICRNISGRSCWLIFSLSFFNSYYHSKFGKFEIIWRTFDIFCQIISNFPNLEW
jgi:hypothetical protein